MDKILTLDTLAQSFGTTVDDITDECHDLLHNMDSRYHLVSGIEREKLIADILHRIDDDKQIIGAPERADKWFKGWKENLELGYLKNISLNMIQFMMLGVDLHTT